MSWSVGYIGTPEKVCEALEGYSKSTSGQSKDEYDAALPHLVALVKENRNDGSGNQTPYLVQIDASGSGTTCNGKEINRSCQVTLKRIYGAMVSLFVAAFMLFGSAARAEDKPQFFLKADGTVEKRVQKVESEVAALKARVAELEKAAGATAAAPKAAPCACGENCPCLALTAAPQAASGHWERQRVGLIRSRDVWVQDAPQAVTTAAFTSSAATGFAECANGQCQRRR